MRTNLTLAIEVQTIAFSHSFSYVQIQTTTYIHVMLQPFTLFVLSFFLSY